jgi:hypothetical protein
LVYGHVYPLMEACLVWVSTPRSPITP